jgi:hypothetical protein
MAAASSRFMLISHAAEELDLARGCGWLVSFGRLRASLQTLVVLAVRLEIDAALTLLQDFFQTSGKRVVLL